MTPTGAIYMFYSVSLLRIRRTWALLGLLASVVVGTGCADGPFGLARYNPVLRDEWKKDEQYGKTSHQRLEEMQEAAARASSMPPAEQERLATELNQVVQNDANTILVSQAVRTLAAIPHPAALEGLRLASNHSDANVRVVACHAWHRRGGDEALDRLTATLNSDTDSDVRIAAARELGGFRDPKVVQALGASLEDGSPALQRRAVESLKSITGKDYGDNIVAWREFVASGEAKPAAQVSWTEKLRPWR